MKLINYLAFGLLTVLSACEKIDIPRDNESESFKKVYLPAAVDLNRMDLVHVDSSFNLTIGASYAGGLDYAPADIPLEFEFSMDSVEAYNLANGTQYKALPLSTLDAPVLKTIISKGAVASPVLTFAINPTKGMDLFEDYLLPITLKGNFSDGIGINTNLSTAYFVIRSKLNLEDFQDFDRSAWKVIGFSSQEETGEGSNNGRAIFMLDNDYSTFWHTRWSGGNALGPHYVEIDMGGQSTIHGLSVVGRTDGGRGRPERVKFEVKNSEGEDWTLLESNLLLENTRDNQRLFFRRSVEARYFRMTVEKTYENTEFTFLAELNVF